MVVIGLMSGTSADGIDAAIMRLEGEPPTLKWELIAHHAEPHPSELRASILACCDPRASSVDAISRLNVALGEAFAQAALSAITAAGMRPQQIDLIGSHGQTVWHAPEGPHAGTLQLGESALIAELTGLPVVSNFRTRDMAAGGQGAPLVAYVDQLLWSAPGIVRATQNIGGIANVTFLPPTGRDGVFAFDTGPGMMLLDAAVAQATDGRLRFDSGGTLAEQGRVDTTFLAQLLDDPYFQASPPKTTGREYFGAQRFAQIWEAAVDRDLAPGDLLATLAAFTAESIANAYRQFLPQQPDEVIVSGGGARHAVVMAQLAAALRPARVFTSDSLGMPAEAKEAAAFALLAYETWHGRPGNLPAATGARHPVVLGSITPGVSSTPFRSSPATGDHLPRSKT